MAPTDAQRKARDKWLAEKVETINVRVPKGEKEHIRTHAKQRGETMNQFLIRAAREAIQRDNEDQ